MRHGAPSWQGATYAGRRHADRTNAVRKGLAKSGRTRACGQRVRHCGLARLQAAVRREWGAGWRRWRRGSAECRPSKATMSAWPLAAAMWSGVRPAWSGAFRHLSPSSTCRCSTSPPSQSQVSPRPRRVMPSSDGQCASLAHLNMFTYKYISSDAGNCQAQRVQFSLCFASCV